MDDSGWSGLFLPPDGPVSAWDTSGAGIIMPNLSFSAAQLGLTPIQADPAWFENFVKAYLTATDYLGVASADLGLPFDSAWFTAALLSQHPREVYVPVLVALNH